MEDAVVSQNETPSEAPNAHRLSFFTLLSRILLAVTCLIGGALTVAGVSVYQSRHEILAQAVHAVEVGASEALGVPVKVGKVAGPYWNGLELRDLTVYASNKPGAPVLAHAPRARASYSILEILKLGKQPIMVDVYGPTLTLARDARGTLNYQPTFKPGPAEPPEIPNLPKVRVRVHSGTATWIDLGMPRTARFQARLSRVSGTADLADKAVTFRATAQEDASRLAVTGKYVIERMAGEVRAEADHVPTARWINYLAPNPNFTITGGAGRVTTAVVWDRPAPEAVKFTGGVELRGMSLEAVGVRRPVEGIYARATFDNTTADVPEIRGTMLGNSFSGSGKVFDLNKPVQRLAFTGGAENVDVASLIPLVPDLAMWEPSGKGSATAVVSGTTMHPIVDGSAVIPQGHVLDQLASNVTGQFHYEGTSVTLPVFQGTLNGGRVWGLAGFTLDQDPVITVDAQYQGVDLGASLAPYLEEALPVAGRLGGKVTVRGTAMRPEVAGSVQVAEARYERQTFDTAKADFTYVKNRWEVPQGELALGAGSVRFSAHGTENGVFAGRFDAGDVALSQLKALGLDVDVAGRATATGSFAGDFTRMEAIRARGQAHVESGVLYGQPVSRASADWAISDRELRLSDVLAQGAGGSVKGHATVALFGQSKLPVLKADFAANGVELGQIEPLQELLVADVGSLRGTVSATGSVQSDGQAWRAQADTVGAGIDAERFGRVTRVAGPVYFGHERITLGDLSLLLANRSPAQLRGSIAFDRPEPAFDLEFSMQDVPARDALSAVHWQRLLQGTWIGRRLGVKETEGPQTTVASFEREPVVDERGDVNLGKLLAHWDRNSLEPLKTNQAYLQAKDPFWQSVDGKLTLEVAYQGLVSKPEVRVKSSLKEAVAYGHPLRSAHLTAVYRNDRLYVPVFDVIEEGGTGAALQARGMLGPDGVLGIYGQNLDLAWANPWLQAQDLELSGTGGFTLLAKGDPSDPRLEISAEVYQGSIAPPGAKPDSEERFTYEQGEVKATYYQGRVTLDNARVVKDGKDARILGSFPVLPGIANDELDVSLALEGDSLGIVTAFTRGEIQWKGGPGTATLKLGGTLEDPELSGVVDLQGVAIRDRNLTEDITNIRAYATITTDAVTIQRAAGNYGGGTITASGQIKLKRFQLDRLRLQVLARQVDFALTNGLYKGMVEASLDITGTLPRPVVGGTVAVSRGVVDLAALTPEEGAASSAAASDVPIELKDLTLRVHQGVTVLGPRQPVVVLADARIFDMGIDGSLNVNGPLSNPQVRGTIRTSNGNINPLNTPFDVVSGNIEFLGPGVANTPDAEFEDLLPQVAQVKTSTLPNARLNIVAKGQVYDYAYVVNGQRQPKNLDIKMTLTGSLDNMERRFEAVNDASVQQDRIERLLGKDSLVTGILEAETEKERNTIVATEVSGFLSTASRRFFTPVTSRLQDFLQLESLGFDLASLPGSDPNSAFFQQLGLNPSVYTQTRPLLGSVSLSGRYTFRQNSENVYQASFNYGINEFLSLNVGLDNLDLKGQAKPTIEGLNFNPSITLSTQRRF